jgi:hypothetical protein
MNFYEFDIKRFGRVLPESVTVEAEGEAIARDKARSEYLRKGEYLGDLRGMNPMDNLDWRKSGDEHDTEGLSSVNGD